jgi:uncharacterized protein (DUF302 family)
MSTGIIIGIVAGVVLGWLIAFLIMPRMMFKESTSKLGFDETVSLIEEQVIAKGWKMPALHDLQATMKKFDHDVMSVKVFEICHPEYSYNILKESEERIASSMMPCRISVYVKEDGSVWISRMNSGVVAKAMSKIVRKSMSDAAADVELIIAEVPTY